MVNILADTARLKGFQYIARPEPGGIGECVKMHPIRLGTIETDKPISSIDILDRHPPTLSSLANAGTPGREKGVEKFKLLKIGLLSPLYRLFVDTGGRKRH